MDTIEMMANKLGLTANRRELNLLLTKYPWFTTARIVKSVVTERSDDLLKLHLEAYPSPRAMLTGVSREVFKEIENEIEKKGNGINTLDGAKENDLDEIIDNFLSGGERRIRASKETPELDISKRGSVFEITEDVATEELANIYMEQGLTEKAEEIYSKLREKEGKEGR